MNSNTIKRILIVNSILLFGILCTSAQKITNWTVVYDNNFNAVVKATVKNTTQKTITTLKFHIGTKPKYLSNNNYTADKTVEKSFSRSISPNGISTFEIPVKLNDNYVIKGIFIDGVRFSDGTIK